MDDKRTLLRHTVATVAYRGAKAVRGVPPAFGAFSPDGSPRTAAKILAHIGDLCDWALTQAKGTEAWNDSTPLEWDREVQRFFASIAAFDAFLASDAPLAATPEKIFQGAIADSLTHIGQLAMMRRLAGVKMKGENYSRADIQPGRVGADQTPPKREFD
jgi:DinB superfamily